MIDKNVLALVATLAIIAVLALLMRKGVKKIEQWADAKRTQPLSSHSQSVIRPAHEVHYQTRPCAGRDAVAAWERAKGEGLGVPLIVVDAPQDGRWQLPQSPQEILSEADRLTDPLPLLVFDRKAKPWPEDVAPNMGSSIVLSYENGQMQFRPEVHIVFVPARDAAEIPAYLGLGGWNACPPAENMVAALRQWNKDYGAELVAVSRDTMELRVARRPATREEAFKLARQQAMFCSDVVEDPDDMLEELAASLMISDWWLFWWD